MTDYTTALFDAPAHGEPKAEVPDLSQFFDFTGFVSPEDDILQASPLSTFSSPASDFSSAASGTFDSPMLGGDFTDTNGGYALFPPAPGPVDPIADQHIASSVASLFESIGEQIATLSPAASVTPTEVTAPERPMKSRRGRPAKVTTTDGSGQFVKDKFTGTRNTMIPAIDFEAPTIPKNYILPSATSRKRAPAAITSKVIPVVAKKLKLDTEEGELRPEDLPEEVLSAIEDKRRQNTLAARRSRMRKVEHLNSLNGEISTLRSELERYKNRCAELEGIVASYQQGKK